MLTFIYNSQTYQVESKETASINVDMLLAQAEKIAELDTILGPLRFSSGRFEHFQLTRSEIDSLIDKFDEALGKEKTCPDN